GHVGTEIVANTMRLHATDPVKAARAVIEQLGASSDGFSDDQVRQMLAQRAADFRDRAPLSAAAAATIILDGVRAGRWRILVGDDAKKIDAQIRAKPEGAYDYTELFSGLADTAG